MISLLLSTLRLLTRWSLWYARSRVILYVVSLARYGWTLLPRGR